MTDLATLAIKVDSTDMGRADTAMRGLGKTGQWLEGILKATVAALATYKITEFIKESALLAARYETLGVVMGVVGNNAGYTSQQMENYARALQETGISMVESRNTLAIMAQAHIDLAKATDLAREAQDAAVVGNINSSEAFQRMIYGIQSGQTDVLRTIGINVNFEASYAKLAIQLGKTSRELTENEKSTARMNAVLEKAPDLAGAYEASMGTAGKQLLSMKRYADDLMTSFGSLFGDALKVGVESVNGALKDMKRWLDENAIAAQLVKENLGGAAENFVGMVKDTISMADGLSEITEGLTFMEIGAGSLALVFAFLRDAVDLIVGGFRELVGLVAKVDQWFVKTFNLPTPEWLDKLLEWGGKQYGAGKAQYQRGFNATSLDQFYNGKPEGDSSSVPFSDSGYKRETGNVAKILEQQRMWSAKHGGNSGKSAGSSGRHGGASSSIDFYQEQEAMEAELAWEQDWLNQRDAAWVSASERRRRFDEQSYNQRQQALQEKDSAYQTSMSIITPYWSQVQSLAQAETALNQALQDGTITFEAYLVGMQNLKDAAPVVTAAFGDLRWTIQDFAQQGTNALVEFCMTGKTSFTSLVNSMIADLARLAIQKNVTGPLGNWVGSLLSGLGSSSIGYQGTSSILSDSGSMIFAPRASGGPVSGNTPYLVGEVGPEVFVPSQSGSIVPNNKLGSTTNQTTITVNVSSDGKTDAKTQAKGATNLSRDLEAAVISIVQKHHRVGGALA